MASSTRLRRRLRVALPLAGLLAPMLLAATAPALASTGLPRGFADTAIVTGLTSPTNVQFAPDGHVFIAEKSGVIKVLDSINDATPLVFADLSGEVHDYWDRGLLGLAIDPLFATTRPYVYVLYSADSGILSPFGTAARWGDTCPLPPGATYDGCVISGRLSRLTAVASTTSPSGFAPNPVETELIHDWCQQFPSHSIGSLVFGADGALYASAGDGASFNSVPDYGQLGGTQPNTTSPVTPKNPCGDPMGASAPATAEGGALRAQDFRTTGDPTGLDGTIIRVDPDTGLALASNPNVGGSDENARRIVAHGMRNPFRITFRPGTDELWVGDVGWASYEEIDRIVSPRTAPVENLGWPCYEATQAPPEYNPPALSLNLCTSLASSAVTMPYYSYYHGDHIVADDGCAAGSSSTTGLAFYNGGSYPAAYDGALFFADQARQCIWVMLKGADGNPDVSTRKLFAGAAGQPVDLKMGPGGDLFYIDLGGSLHRITYTAGNQTPVAVATATPSAGLTPLTVTLDGTGSSDADGDPITYSWDLDGDGVFGDATTPTASWTYRTSATVLVGLRVSDGRVAGSTTVRVSAGNTPPVPTILSPAPTNTSNGWHVGDLITVSGSATDNSPAPVALHWDVVLQHCPSNCHPHVVESHDGPSFSFSAPDHDYPSYLELRLTATDGEGLQATTSVRLDPKTVDLTIASDPPGLTASSNGVTAVTPFTQTVIAGSAVSLTISSPQTLGGVPRTFGSWSDGGAQTHALTAPAAATTYTAQFTPGSSPPAPSVAAPPVPRRAFGLSVVTNFDSAGRRSASARWFVPFGSTTDTSRVRFLRGSLAPTSLLQGVSVTAVNTLPARAGDPGIAMSATLPALATGATYAVSVIQVGPTGTPSSAVSKVVTVPRVAGPAGPMSTLTSTPVDPRWRLTDRGGVPMPGRRVAILVRAKGTTRWRTYAYAITNRTGFVGLRIALRSGTEFAVRYAGDSAHVGAQSVALVITVRADNVL